MTYITQTAERVLQMSFTNDSPRIKGSTVEIDFTSNEPTATYRCHVRDMDRNRTFEDCKLLPPCFQHHIFAFTGSSRSVVFSDLTPGRYIFIARGRASPGNSARIRRAFWIGELAGVFSNNMHIGFICCRRRAL